MKSSSLSLGKRRRTYVRMLGEIQHALLEALDEENRDRGLTRAEIARILGKNKSFVTRKLSGDTNMTLESLADIAFALDRPVKISLPSRTTPPSRPNRMASRMASGKYPVRQRRREPMSKHDAKTREPRLFPWADDRIEAVVKADFLAFCIYRGYNDEVKRLEWERMRNIEVGRFKRRLAALLGPRVLPPDACPAHGHGEPCFYCGDLCNCWTGNPGLLEEIAKKPTEDEAGREPSPLTRKAKPPSPNSDFEAWRNYAARVSNALQERREDPYEVPRSESSPKGGR